MERWDRHRFPQIREFPPPRPPSITPVGAGIMHQISGTLAESRKHADRILDSAASDARALESRAEEEVRERARARLEEIEDLRASIEHHSAQIEAAYVRMVEAMAAASMRLVQISRRADFTPPRWPGGIERTVELKLSETREMTIRFGARSAEDVIEPTERDYNRPGAMSEGREDE